MNNISLLVKSLVRLLLILMVILSLSILTYKLTSSIYFSVAIFLLFFILYRLYQLIRKVSNRQVIKNFHKVGVVGIYEKPLDDFFGDVWCKGFSYVENKRFLVWLIADKNGIVFYFASYARRKPVMVPWGKVIRVEWWTGSSNEDVAGAKVYLQFYPYEIIVPWRYCFAKEVPDKVGIEKIDV